MSGLIIHGDSTLPSLVPHGSVQLVVTSPPYGVGKEYDDHNDTREGWMEMLGKVFWRSWQALENGGRMCVNVHHESGRSPSYPTGMLVQQMLEQLPDSINRGTIVWDKKAEAGPSTAWGSWMSPANPSLRGTYEMIYVYSKATMARDVPWSDGQGTDLPEPTLVKADITGSEFMKASLDVWSDIGTRSEPGHPAPFPVGLPQRLIQFYSWPGDMVYDPFLGSGTTGLAAQELGRDWVGSEISAEYCKLASRRCATFEGMEVEIVDAS